MLRALGELLQRTLPSISPPIFLLRKSRISNTWELGFLIQVGTSRSSAQVGTSKRLSKLWRSTILSNSLKLRLFVSLIAPVFVPKTNLDFWQVCPDLSIFVLNLS